MSDHRTMFVDGAERLFRDLREAGATDHEAVWPAIEEMGFVDLLVPEADGGIGGDVGDAVAILQLAGRHALAAPLAEAMIGRLVTVAVGGGQGFVTIAARADGKVEQGRFSGKLAAVPWGRHARAVVFTLDGQDHLVEVSAATVKAGANPAGEPRDTLVFNRAEVVALPARGIFLLGALARAAQIAGGLEAALELSIGYANDRVQFGRSIGKFQVIQHNLAQFAEEAAAAAMAAQAAAAAVDTLADPLAAEFEIACAKARASKAAVVGQATAHAVHGAIGFTMEHPLNHFTRRLLGWRSEYGGQDFWTERLGDIAIEMGRNGFWASLSGRSDSLSAHSVS